MNYGIPWLSFLHENVQAFDNQSLRRLPDTRHGAVNSLAPRRRSGERARERGNPINTALLSPALSSLRGGEGDARRAGKSSIAQIHRLRQKQIEIPFELKQPVPLESGDFHQDAGVAHALDELMGGNIADL